MVKSDLNTIPKEVIVVLVGMTLFVILICVMGGGI